MAGKFISIYNIEYKWSFSQSQIRGPDVGIQVLLDVHGKKTSILFDPNLRGLKISHPSTL